MVVVYIDPTFAVTLTEQERQVLIVALELAVATALDHPERAQLSADLTVSVADELCDRLWLAPAYVGQPAPNR